MKFVDEVLSGMSPIQLKNLAEENLLHSVQYGGACNHSNQFSSVCQ